MSSINKTNQKSKKAGFVCFESPSNIALVKYWGKYGIQLPRNPNISFTLKEAKTTTSIEYKPTNSGKNQLDFEFEGQPNEAFKNRIKKYIDSISHLVSTLKEVDLSIKSSNTFPHSSGIASSASAMSALAACIHQIECNILSQPFDKAKVSSLSRLGSGSASRSIYPKIAAWGECSFIENSHNEYAVPYQNHVHKIFHDFRDSIILVDESEKSVSSSAGHSLMNTNPYASARYSSATQNLKELCTALQTGNLNDFIEIVEREALTLHGLMMSSQPSYVLMKPNTLFIIEKIRQFREETKLPICFTLDAGPNIHVLYPKHCEEKIKIFLTETCSKLPENLKILHDEVGNGTNLVKNL